MPVAEGLRLAKSIEIVNLTQTTIHVFVPASSVQRLHEAGISSTSTSKIRDSFGDTILLGYDVACLKFNTAWPKLGYSMLLRDGYLRVGSHDLATSWALALENGRRASSWRGRSGWETVIPLCDDVLGASTWKFYRMKISRNHHRLVILPSRNLAAFLSQMPSSLHLSSLLLPGTHDTLAFYGYPVSQCQSPDTPLAVQLRSGVRVFDLRFSIVDGALIAYHGSSPQYLPYLVVLRIFATFLRSSAGRTETVVVSIKQEDGSKGQFRLFSKLVHDGLYQPDIKDLWFLENRIPTLGEVRGKAVLFSRFGGDGAEWEGGLEGIGIHPTTWPDSDKEGFGWVLKDTIIRTQDWYAIPSFLSVPEKFSRAVQLLSCPTFDRRDKRKLEEKPTGGRSRSFDSLWSSAYENSSEKTLLPSKTLAITFFSAATFPLALPQMVALGFGWPEYNLGVEGVNNRLGRWLLDTLAGDDVVLSCRRCNKHRNVISEKRIRGWAFMDFYDWPHMDKGIVSLLVECNFRGRTGDEGWDHKV